MATVTSLTKEQIEALAAEWQTALAEQEIIRASLIEILTQLGTNSELLEQLQNMDIPALQEQVGGTASEVSDLRDNVIPRVEFNNNYNSEAIQTLQDMQDTLQQDLNGVADNANALTKTFYSDTPPPEFDETTERYLAVGDTWYDTTPGNGNRQYTWTGTIWSPFTVEVADFALTARKFKTSTHMLY